MFSVEPRSSFNSTPSWPSLYDPGIEILHIEHREAVQRGGEYLYHAHDIFRFTLYWSLVLYTPIFIVCGLYAFINLSFPPSRVPHDHESSSSSYPLSPLSPTSSTSTPLLLRPTKPHKTNERRSRLTFTLLVLLTFLALGVAGAVVGSAVLGFVLAGLFKAAKYNMSTWVPFLWVVIQILIGFLSIWPSVIDII